MINPALKLPRKDLAAFCKRHGIRALSLFGSATRADFTADSDVDVLLEFEADTHYSLFDMVDLKEELAHIFGRPVDVTTPEIFRNPYRREAIMKDLERVYVA